MPFLFPTRRNLLLIAQPAYLATQDLFLIRDLIHKSAPDVNTFIVGSQDNPSLMDPSIWRHPSITVSFAAPGQFVAPRGPLLANRPIHKVDQFKALSAAGISTPLTKRFIFGEALNEAIWGPLVILKPADFSMTSSGTDLYLFRTSRISEIRPVDVKSRHQKISNDMILQQFINTGDYFSVYRSLTLFGEVLYQNLAVAPEPHPPLDSSDEIIESILPEPDRSKTIPLINFESDVMNFAKCVATAFPDVPLLGCDILREKASGKLYALEVNAGGNVWHFSSPRTQKWRRVDRVMEYVKAFDSFNVAAQVLIRVTRQLAS